MSISRAKELIVLSNKTWHNNIWSLWLFDKQHKMNCKRKFLSLSIRLFDRQNFGLQFCNENETKFYFSFWHFRTFWGPLIVIYSYNRSQQDALFLSFNFDIQLYTFRTYLLSIIRNLYTAFTETGICHAIYVDCLTADSQHKCISKLKLRNSKVGLWSNCTQCASCIVILVNSHFLWYYFKIFPLTYSKQ